MNHRSPFSLFALLIVTTAMIMPPVAAEAPSFLKMFRRASTPEADVAKADELSEEDGPWLILASTFVGEGARKRAERLATEIRSELGLPAFIHRENFDFTGTINRNPQTFMATRYANRYRYDAYAVLVGEYDSTEHPDIERDLKSVRTAHPAVFQDPNEVAAENFENNPVTTLKSFTRKVLTKGRREPPKGPMSQAFVTRNPMLPEQYFQAPSVDSFVHEMNDGLNHSLLECDGKYTVVVKTFEGLGAIVDGRQDKKFRPSTARLNQFAADAEKMTTALRKQGVEAYQFHDRYRSLVTIGSFDTLGREMPGGGFEYAPEIRAVMRKYSALNVRPELARQVPSGVTGVVGMRSAASNNVAMIPYDVEPKPIAVPKPSKRSLYGSALGMR